MKESIASCSCYGCPNQGSSVPPTAACSIIRSRCTTFSMHGRTAGSLARQASQRACGAGQEAGCSWADGKSGVPGASATPTQHPGQAAPHLIGRRCAARWQLKMRGATRDLRRSGRRELFSTKPGPAASVNTHRKVYSFRAERPEARPLQSACLVNYRRCRPASPRAAPTPHLLPRRAGAGGQLSWKGRKCPGPGALEKAACMYVGAPLGRGPTEQSFLRRPA